MPPFCGSLNRLLSSPQNGGTPWQERAESAVRAPAAQAGSNHVLVPQRKVTKVGLEGPYKQGQSQPLPKQALRVALRNDHKKDCAPQHIWVLFNWGNPSLRWGKIPGVESYFFAEIFLHT